MQISRRTLLKAGIAFGAVAVGTPLRDVLGLERQDLTFVEFRAAATGTRESAEPRIDLINGNFRVDDLHELLGVKSLDVTGPPALPPYETALAVSGLASYKLQMAVRDSSVAVPSVLVGGDPDPGAVTICVMPTKAFYPYPLDLVTTVIQFPASDGSLLEEAIATLPDSPKKDIEFILTDTAMSKIESSEVTVLSLP